MVDGTAGCALGCRAGGEVEAGAVVCVGLEGGGGDGEVEKEGGVGLF